MAFVSPNPELSQDRKVAKKVSLKNNEQATASEGKRLQLGQTIDTPNATEEKVGKVTCGKIGFEKLLLIMEKYRQSYACPGLDACSKKT